MYVYMEKVHKWSLAALKATVSHDVISLIEHSYVKRKMSKYS